MLSERVSRPETGMVDGDAVPFLFKHNKKWLYNHHIGEGNKHVTKFIREKHAKVWNVL